MSASAGETPGCWRIPRTEATAWGTRSGSESGASSTSHTPSSYSSTNAEATARARRVLPEPPGPVSVSKRASASRPSTSEISRSRPTRPVSWRGRLLGERPRPGFPGNSTTDPGSPVVFLGAGCGVSGIGYRLRSSSLPVR